MKKIVFALAGAALLAAALAGCSNSSDGGAGIGLANGITAAPNGGAPTDGNNPGAQPGGGTTGGTPEVSDPNAVLINASNLVYIGEVTETIDSVEYKVKKYADVLVDNPYFYTYYKVYYLNGKCRRIYRFDHGIGCDMDYKYDEFVEHTCGCYAALTGLTNALIYTYYENGKLESQLDSSGKIVCTYTYYDRGKLKELTIYNSDGAVSQKTVYYDSGKKKLFVDYNSGAISYFYCYYESGYYKHYYSSGKFYTYLENKKLTSSSTNSSDYSSCEDFTPEQAAAKLEELKNN